MTRILKGSHSFTCTPCVHLLMVWTIPAFAFPAEAGAHLPTLEGWKAENWLRELAWRNTCTKSGIPAFFTYFVIILATESGTQGRDWFTGELGMKGLTVSFFNNLDVIDNAVGIRLMIQCLWFDTRQRIVWCMSGISHLCCFTPGCLASSSVLMPRDLTIKLDIFDIPARQTRRYF